MHTNKTEAINGRRIVVNQRAKERESYLNRTVFTGDGVLCRDDDACEGLLVYSLMGGKRFNSDILPWNVGFM